MMIVLCVILILVVIAAVYAVESRDLTRSVISLAAGGAGLCAAFLVLGAYKIAMMQLVFEVLMLLILMRATSKTSSPASYSGRELLAFLASVVFIVVVLAGSFQAFSSLPEVRLRASGPDNSAAALAAVLAAAVGTLAVLRPKGRKGTDHRRAGVAFCLLYAGT
jgi:uncharacterized MnhB-related membrane protein